MLKVKKYDDVIRIEMARTIAGRGRYWTTAYWVDGLLVDSGCVYTAEELGAYLKDKPITHIVNTHKHEDHLGANGLLQRERPDLEILAHPLALPVLANPRGQQPLQFYRRVMWGWPEPSTAQPLEDGAVIETSKYRFQVIYTPGHSPCHICLYEPEQEWLFTGDLFVGGKDRALGASYKIWQIIASLKKVSNLPLKMLFPGSARVRKEPKEELSTKIRYLEELGERILDMHRQGRSEKAIIREVCGGPMFIEVFTGGNFSRKNLVRAFIRGREYAEG